MTRPFLSFSLPSWYYNPVFRREMLTRWRHPSAFVLVVAYALVIAAIMAFHFYDARNGTNEARLGHEIWQTLMVAQTVAWMLLGPILTSGALAGEREKGHLDALRLSPLSAHEIVAGKLFGALSLAFLLLLVPLPSLALCFLLGGVSPTEFLFSFVLSFFTALTGMSIGLVVSAQSRDNGQAILRALMQGIWFQLLINAAQLLLCCLPIISPIWLMYKFLGDTSDLPWWQIAAFALVQIWITRRQLKSAEQFVTKPPPTLEKDFYLYPSYAYSYPSAYNSAFTVPTAIAPVAPRKESPLLDLIRFDNPVLQREARQRVQFRWSRDNNTNDVVIGLAFIVFMIWTVPLTLVVWFEPSQSLKIWWLVSLPWLFFAMGFAALTTSVAITREREGGHWEQLWLTPLTRHEIIGGKLQGVLFGIGFWSLCLVPFWIPCLVHLGFGITFGTLFIIASAAFLAANVGLFYSAICRKSSTALNWTILTLLVWWISHSPSQNWKSASLTDALWHSIILFGLGELLYLATHRILRRAPYEN